MRIINIHGRVTQPVAEAQEQINAIVSFAFYVASTGRGTAEEYRQIITTAQEGITRSVNAVNPFCCNNYDEETGPVDADWDDYTQTDAIATIAYQMVTQMGSIN